MSGKRPPNDGFRWPELAPAKPACEQAMEFSMIIFMVAGNIDYRLLQSSRFLNSPCDAHYTGIDITGQYNDFAIRVSNLWNYAVTVKLIVKVRQHLDLMINLPSPWDHHSFQLVLKEMLF